MNILLVRDIVQLISQYSPQVYCTLRLVNQEVKEMVDEVLPKTYLESFLLREKDSLSEYGFKLLDLRDFADWLHLMRMAYRSDLKHIHKAEKFCRDYLPKEGVIDEMTLFSLCELNLGDYVRELWEAGDKKTRFYDDCIKEICMLDDYELFASVYEYFDAKITLNIAKEAALHAARCNRWKNFFHVLDKYPNEQTSLYTAYCHALVELLEECKQVAFAGKDKKKVLELLQKDGFLIKFADESLRSDREVVMEAVRHGGISEIPYQFEADKDVVMVAVKDDGCALEYADKSLRKDKDVVMAAVKQSGWALEFADKSLRKDKDVVMAAVSQLGTALEFADISLRKDKEIVLAAVKQNGSSLQIANATFRKDREIVMEAVKKDGWVLEVADPSFRRDKEIVMEAVKQDGTALEFASRSLKRDKDVIMAAVKQNGDALLFVEFLRQDEEIFYKEIVLEAVKRNGTAVLAFAPVSLRKDKEIVMAAEKKDETETQFSDESLQDDESEESLQDDEESVW